MHRRTFTQLLAAAAQATARLYSSDLLHAIDWALKPNEEDRPQDTATLAKRLGTSAQGARTATQHAQPVPDTTPTRIVMPAATQVSASPASTAATRWPATRPRMARCCVCLRARERRVQAPRSR